MSCLRLIGLASLPTHLQEHQQDSSLILVWETHSSNVDAGLHGGALYPLLCAAETG